MGAAALCTGCASFHPVPAGHQQLAQAEVGGVVISVPRLQSGNYPGDVLDIATAVMVVIENRSRSEILVEPERFVVHPADGTPMSPIKPQQLTRSPQQKGLADGHGGAKTGLGFSTARLTASLGSGVYLALPPPQIAPQLGVQGLDAGRSYPGVPVRLIVPGWDGGYYTPRSYPYAQSRWSAWVGGPLYWGAAWWVGWYGNPWFWPWFYDGPRYHTWSREDAVRLALPSGRLPAGGRTGGFLFFPRLMQPEGLPLVLQGSIREAKNQRVLGTAKLALELRAD